MSDNNDFDKIPIAKGNGMLRAKVISESGIMYLVDTKILVTLRQNGKGRYLDYQFENWSNDLGRPAK